MIVHPNSNIDLQFVLELILGSDLMILSTGGSEKNWGKLARQHTDNTCKRGTTCLQLPRLHRQQMGHPHIAVGPADNGHVLIE